MELKCLGIVILSLSNAENGQNICDFLSNGFKFRHQDGRYNNDNTFIYLAFGQSLVGSNNVPCTAR